MKASRSCCSGVVARCPGASVTSASAAALNSASAAALQQQRHPIRGGEHLSRHWDSTSVCPWYTKAARKGLLQLPSGLCGFCFCFGPAANQDHEQAARAPLSSERNKAARESPTQLPWRGGGLLCSRLGGFCFRLKACSKQRHRLGAGPCPACLSGTVRLFTDQPVRSLAAARLTNQSQYSVSCFWTLTYFESRQVLCLKANQAVRCGPSCTRLLRSGQMTPLRPGSSCYQASQSMPASGGALRCTAPHREVLCPGPGIVGGKVSDVGSG